MVKVGDVRDYLFSIAPEKLKMDFDNVGLLVGSEDNAVTRALFSLDITSAVIDEAASLGAELIVSHHPVIWDAMKSVTEGDIQSRKVIKLIKNDISAICMHTNLDIAEGGVNDVLMARLGGRTTGILEMTGENAGCGRVGELERETPLSEFLGSCKKALAGNGLRYYDAGRPVKKLAVMGGSGGDCAELAFSLGCDTYLTADIKYDQFLTARELGLNLIDADHFCTENPVVSVLESLVKKRFPEIITSVSGIHSQTAEFF